MLEGLRAVCLSADCESSCIAMANGESILKRAYGSVKRIFNAVLHRSSQEWSRRSQKALDSVAKHDSCVSSPVAGKWHKALEAQPSEYANRAWAVQSLQMPPRRASDRVRYPSLKQERNVTKSHPETRSCPRLGFNEYWRVIAMNESHDDRSIKPKRLKRRNFGGIFRHHKAAMRFLHLREERRRPEAATHPVGDLNELRQVRERQWASYWQFQDMREPTDGYGATRDILSVMKMCERTNVCS